MVELSSTPCDVRESELTGVMAHTLLARLWVSQPWSTTIVHPFSFLSFTLHDTPLNRNFRRQFPSYRSPYMFFLCRFARPWSPFSALFVFTQFLSDVDVWFFS